MQNGDNPQLSTATTPEVSTSTVQPFPTSTQSRALSSSLDAIGRSTATAVILIYGVGFVILGFHDAKYGVVQFSPFRARIFLVGFVFIMVIALAAAAQHYGFSQLPSLESVRTDSEPKRRRYRELILQAGFIYTANIISAILGTFLFGSAIQAVKSSDWLTAAEILTALVGGTLFIPVGQMYLAKPRLAAILSFVAFGMIMTPLSFHSSPAFYLTFTLVLAGWHTNLIKRDTNLFRYALDYRNWLSILMVLWLYISQVFSIVPPRWGGGQPVPVQILQNTPAPWLGSNPADVLLLDETDQGLYVLLSPTGKAYFVPRSNVASMFFGTKDELPKKP